MTDAIKWDEWVLERRRTAGAVSRLAERTADVRLRRTRTEEERRALRQANLDTIARAQETGRIVWLGESHARIARGTRVVDDRAAR